MNQSDFEALVTHAITQVVEQGKRAVNKNRNSCAYLTPEGDKCAIGHTMTEQELKKYANFVGGISSLLNNTDYGKDRNLTEDQIIVLIALQIAHDTCPDWESPTKFARAFYKKLINGNAFHRFPLKSIFAQTSYSIT